MNFILIYLLMHLHFLLANSIQNFAEISAVRGSRSLAQCICEVSKREYFWKATTVLKIEANQTKTKSDFINDLSEIFAMESIPYFSSENTNIINSAASYLLVNYFDNRDALLHFDFGAIQKKIKYLLVLNYSSRSWDSDFQRIRDRVGKYDVTFLLKVSESKYKMVTLIPIIDWLTCKTINTNHVEINTCDNGYLTANESFPSKDPTNLRRCPFKVGIGTLYPFATIQNKESLKNFDSLKGVAIQGMDVEIIKMFAEHIDATLDLYYIFKLEGNPYVHMEYVDLVVNGSLDACAGGLYRIFGDVVEYSGVYARQTVCWLYTADRLSLTWEHFIVNIDGLHLFIIFYVSYSIVWYIVCVFDEHTVSLRDTWLYSLGALVGTTSLSVPRSFKQKVLNIVYLNMCLHLTVYISIQFFSFLTVRMPPEIFQSNDDIMSSGRKLYLNALTKYFVKDERYEIFANTSIDCSSYINCSLESLRNKGVTAILDSYFIDFQALTAVNDEARVLRPRDNLLLVYYEMIINKDSPLVRKFQKTIERLHEAGITNKLFENAIGVTKVDMAKSASRNIMGNSYSCQEGCAISFEHISGVFFLWLSGCGLASGLFVVEILFMGRK